MATSYPDVLILVRLESYVRAHWPERRFRYDRHWPGGLESAQHVYFHYIVFMDDAEPRAVGMGLDDAEATDSLFEVIECHAPNRVHRAWWRYGADGWQIEMGKAQADAVLSQWDFAFKVH